MSIKAWAQAIRVPFLTATVIPVALGSIIGWYDRGAFMWGAFALAMIGAALIHTGTNLINDYFDHRSGCDEANQTPTPFSGGSRVIQQRKITPQWVLGVALATFIIGSAIGLFLNYVCGGNVILLIGIIGVFLGFFYSATPLRIGYGGWGELSVGIGFGPLMVMGAYYVQARVLPFHVFLASIPTGLLIAMVLYVNEFPDYRADKSVGKRTLVVILGKEKAVVLYHVLLGLTYATIALLAAFKIIPLLCVVALVSIPLAVKAFVVSRDNFDKICEFLPANALTIGLHSIIGVLLCVGFIADKLLFRR